MSLGDFPILHGASERRGHERHATSTRAQLSVAEQTWPVRIEDFSASGLLLSFDEPLPTAAQMAQWLGESACVSLLASDGAATWDASATAFELPARVVRVSEQPPGVGLAIDALPARWRDALTAADPTHTPERSNPGTAGGDYRDLIARCHAVYETFVRRLASEALGRAADRLGALEGEDPFAAARARFADARAMLAGASAELIQRYVDERMQSVNTPADAINILDVPVDPNDLRLLQPDELEQYLAVSALVKRISEAVAMPLDQFEGRYMRISGQAIERGKSALAPEPTLRGFQHALSTLDISAPSARIVFDALEAVAIERMPRLLEDINHMLLAVAPMARPTASPSSTTRTPAWALPSAALPDAKTQLVLSGLRMPGAAAASPTRRLRVLDAMATATEALRRREKPVSAHTLALEEDVVTLPSATLSELIAAIERLPASSGGAFEQAGMPEIEASARATTATTEAGERGISRTHQHIIEQCSRLFRRAGEDFIPGGDIEALMKRLESTLLKLALRDGEFPSSPQHPARQVMNLIDQYNVAADDAGRLHDPHLQGSLDAFVTRMCEQADHDPTVFGRVQRNLEQDAEGLRRERRMRADRIIEALESRDRIRAARDHVETALTGRLSERRVPRVVIRLLDEAWRQYLIMVHLRFGAASRQWQDSLLLIERTLTTCVVGLGDAATLPLREALYRDLDALLAEMVSDDGLRQRLLDDLHRLMLRADPALVDDRIDAPRFSERGTHEEASAIARVTSGANRLHAGSWWDMQIERKWLPVQLVWISESGRHLGFVNRSATNRMELTATEFEKQRDRGGVRSRESLDIPLLDRSEITLLAEAFAANIAQADTNVAVGLPTRRALQKQLTTLAAQRDGGRQHLLALIECDPVRTIASNCGADALERLTRDLGDAFIRALPKDATVALLREDAFALVLPNSTREGGLRRLSDLLAKLTDFKFAHAEHSYRIAMTAGVAVLGSGPDDAIDAIEALRQADTACLAAKASGERVRAYVRDADGLRAEESLASWAGRWETLLASDQLFLRAQMIAPIAPGSGEKPYYELLLGLPTSGEHTASPYEFVTALERLGRAHEIDLWVVREAFQWLRDNRGVLSSIAGFSINLSSSSLQHPDVLGLLRREMRAADFPAHAITFEITESAAIRDFDVAERFIQEVRRYGGRFALDDFGSGFTSYAHLKRLSIDTVKIDGSYVKEMLLHPSDTAIVKSMTDIAHTLDMRVVAEWVESVEIAKRLAELGVDYAQGWGIHVPVALSSLVAPAT
ncbi:MAG: DUF1631 family protein [Proteobacteria bacterium]|nr:DUF1631 family protein [Pseudomonadota bacterium]